MKVSRIVVMTGAIAALSLAILGGCAGTATERSFGDAVRATLAHQRVPPTASPAQPHGTDAQRMENVMAAHRALVGDPSQVAPELQVDKGQGSQ